ncbi:MAG: sugar ABC transporter permease [Clostridia bacterium]|nr:sugar ABC transporter permease [Clostridia bacterium]
MKRGLNLSQKRELKGLVFVAPFALGMLFFFLIPLVQSFIFSFGDVRMNDALTGYQFDWGGIDNYVRALFRELNFTNELRTSVVNMLMNVPVIVMVSFLIAVLIKDKFVGRSLYRVLFFLPVILTAGILPNIDAEDVLQGLMGSGVVVGADAKNTVAGLINTDQLSDLLLSMNIMPGAVNYLMEAIRNIITIVNNSGIQILIFLTALQTISPSINEAARVEGATPWEIFWKITVPMISPQLLVVTIYTIIDSFVNVNNSLMQYIYRIGFVKFEVGYAASMTWMYFLIVALVIGAFYFALSRFVFYNDSER